MFSVFNFLVLATLCALAWVALRTIEKERRGKVACRKSIDTWLGLAAGISRDPAAHRSLRSQGGSWHLASNSAGILEPGWRRSAAERRNR